MAALDRSPWSPPASPMSIQPIPSDSSSNGGARGLSIDAAAEYVASKSLLSDKAILHHLQKGSVLIEPFVMENLSTSSYDVTLGRYYYRESTPEPGAGVYNPYSAAMVARVWGTPKEAEEAGSWMDRTGTKLDNISPSDRIIWLAPGETILGHTNEFLGGRRTVTTMMKARSSMGRNFIEVCKASTHTRTRRRATAMATVWRWTLAPRASFTWQWRGRVRRSELRAELRMLTLSLCGVSCSCLFPAVRGLG